MIAYEEMARLMAFDDGAVDVPTKPDMWRERFAKLRHRYRNFASLVNEGLASWEQSNPYDIADWMNIFTPIERAAWSDIRDLPFSVWPQFPVGKYVVDFAIVHKRIAIECDGAAYHDAARDSARDAELLKMDWYVIRISGRDCWSEKCAEILKAAA